jgi:hypothetical protein
VSDSEFIGIFISFLKYNKLEIHLLQIQNLLNVDCIQWNKKQIPHPPGKAAGSGMTGLQWSKLFTSAGRGEVLRAAW